ncbi:flavodoxin family protein [Kitasatospora sp. NPDC101183]|uniref:flavodoxin family protein n=1 Tax=Kitasatospora sp. NPDC101183 TaxID=3364100 RepID=UPI003826E3E7
MKTVIVCASVSHGNTRRIADAMAQVLGAQVVSPEEADLTGADLVGFGSGVYYARLHPSLREFVEGLPQTDNKAFVFATSGFAVPYTRPLARRLAGKGFEVVGSFDCRALDTWGPFKLLGGIHKHRPNSDDLAAARAFASRLR